MPLVVLCGAGLLFIGSVLEIALRAGELRTSHLAELQCAGTLTLLEGQKGLFRLEPESGFALRPDVCVRLRSSEYDQVLRTNDRGFVGPDIPTTRSPGRVSRGSAG